MKSKLLIASVVVALATALVLGPANFSFDASAKNHVDVSQNDLTGNGPSLSFTRSALAGTKSNDRSQHCGTLFARKAAGTSTPAAPLDLIRRTR